MAQVNGSRIWIGALVAWIVWGAWTTVVHVSILGPHYQAAQEAGQILAEPRYPYFLPIWFVTLFLLSYLVARLYAALRQVWGPGRGTALKLGLLVGFAAGFPVSFTVSAWASFDRIIALWWLLDMWGGALIAAYLAGWLYRDPKAA